MLQQSAFSMNNPQSQQMSSPAMNQYQNHSNMQLQQTYKQLSNRAMEELNDEIKRLKDIIMDKDEEINKLKEITNQGTLQKKLAKILEENNNLKLQINEENNNKKEIKEIKQSLNTKHDQIYRFQEKINLLNEEYQELMNKNNDLNKELISKTEIIANNKYKDSEIVSLNNKVRQYEQLINDLKNATKITDLESEINALNGKINSKNNENVILNENNKNLTNIYNEIKTKYTKLLNDFDTNLEENQLKSNKKLNILTDTANDLKLKLKTAINKNASLKKQMSQLQVSYKEMEELNLKLIKGYNLTDIINDLQIEKNQKLNLQNELKQITKTLSKKEKTNLVLLNKNKMLTQTLTLNKNIDTNEYDIDDEESTYFDHTDQIEGLQQNIESLNNKIDKLESDKYKLLIQIHEQDNDNNDDENDKLYISGLDSQQQNKVKLFVQKMIKKSLMPSNIDLDDTYIDADDVDGGKLLQLQKENTKLKEWKDMLMTKLFENGTVNINTNDTVELLENRTVENEPERKEDCTQQTRPDMVDLLGISCADIDKNAADNYMDEIKALLDKHGRYVNIVLNVLEDGDKHCDILVNGEKNSMRLQKENEILMDKIEDLKGYKVRHGKIVNILKEKAESELIKKVDDVTKENMILVVNQKKLSRKYVDVKKQQRYLFGEYQSLLRYLMEIEQYLFDKLLSLQSKNDNLCIFIAGILSKISNKMMPLEQYRNIETECKSLYETKQYLLAMVDKFESHSVEYFKCKRDNITLHNKLIEMEGKKEEMVEVIYNAELECGGHENKYKSSIRMTEHEMEKRGRKFEYAMNEIKEMEQYSAMLYEQINGLRANCLDQTKTISDLEKKLNSYCELEQYNTLERKYEKLSIEYKKKLSEIEQFKQKTEFAVSSLQTLQSKIISTFDIGIDGDVELEGNKIGNILKKTQDINNKFALHEQTVKSLKDKVCSFEVEILKKDRKYNDLQMKYFNIEKSKRFLEANFNCIYSKTLHKISSKYLSEIDSLRSKNEELYEYLHAEQIKTKHIYADMNNHKTIIESFKIKIENLNNLIQQYEITGDKDTDESNKYLKNWQRKCTNLEIKQIELVNNSESLQNEIQFLRNENKKYLLNIGSLQKQLSVSNQELQNTKHEIVKKYEINQVQQSLMEHIAVETETKYVQTAMQCMVENGKEERNENTSQHCNKLQAKIVSLQQLIAALQNESANTEKKVSAATEGLQFMLKTAQDTIHSLQTLISQKNESVEEYKNMINKLLSKIKEQQKKYTLHINALKLKYQTNMKENDEMIIAQIQNGRATENINSGWIEMSQIKTTLAEKVNVIQRLTETNNELNKKMDEDMLKINMLTTRIDEYHDVIQELNDKIIDLSDSLNSFKTKLSSKKKENLHLQKAVRSLKENMQKTDNSKMEKVDNYRKCDKNEEMDNKMKSMESEYKILRSSLKSEIDTKKDKINEFIMKKQELVSKNNQLIAECDKLRGHLTKKNKLIHKLQIQISKIQKDKITMQEKHSLSLKINKKKINNLEKTINKNKIGLEQESKQSNKLQKELDDKCQQLNKTKIKIQNLRDNISKLQKIKDSKQEMDVMDENKQELEELNIKYTESQKEIFSLKKVIELEQMKEIKILKTENKSLKRKYELLNKDSNNMNENKEITKLFEEIENKENIIIDLETKISELKFDREHLEINCSKLQKENKNNKNIDNNINISSRNDPQLQNVLDSMKFIIRKLKKENENLKKEKKPSDSPQLQLRITNLLKDNRSLKKKVNEMNDMDKYSDNQQLSIDIQQKRLEIERITNLNKRLKKENINLKEMNEKYLKRNSFKNEEINHLRKTIGDERDNLKQEINEINIIWKRKMSLTNDDLLRYKKIKKDFEKELMHKNEINSKMSNEIKALIELIDHTKNISKQEKENEKLNIKKMNDKIKSVHQENQELRSELSAFDVSFFNEIEDLKYRESQAQQLVIELQAQLQNNTNHVNNNANDHDLNVLQE